MNWSIKNKECTEIQKIEIDKFLRYYILYAKRVSFTAFPTNTLRRTILDVVIFVLILVDICQFKIVVVEEWCRRIQK